MATPQTAGLPSSIAGQPPQQWIPGPGVTYVTGEESLRLTTFGNAAGAIVTITGRVLRPDNTISRVQATHTPNSNRTAATTIVALPEGWLLGIECKLSTGTPTFGSVWGQLELVTGGANTVIAVQSLANDFISPNAPLIFPSGANVDPLDGAGCVRSITGTTPGAGVNLTETVPSNARWDLLAVRFQLVTSAAVANRVLSVVLDDGANIYFQTSPESIQAASLTILYDAAQGTPAQAIGNLNFAAMPLPIGIRMLSGHRLRSVVNAIDVADQISSLQYLVREWFDV